MGNLFLVTAVLGGVYAWRRRHQAFRSPPLPHEPSAPFLSTQPAPSDIDGILDVLCEVGHHQRIHFLWRPSLRDPRDELVLELAVAAGCRQIITFNGRDFAGSERLGVEVVTPAKFLQSFGDRP